MDRRQACGAISKSLIKAAATDNAADWKSAGGLIVEFGASCYPQLLLPAELADRIVGLKLEEPFLPPELWRLISSYAASCDEASAVGADNLLLARVAGLHLAGGRTNDAMTLAGSLFGRFAGSVEDLQFEDRDIRLALKDLAVYLFAVGQYDACARMNESLLTSGCRISEFRFRWKSERSLALSFLGRFSDARTELPIDGFIYGNVDRWYQFARGISWIADDRRRCMDGLRAIRIGTDQSSFFGRLLNALINEMLADASAAVFDAVWLREKHAAASKRFQADDFREVRPKWPMFATADLLMPTL